MLVSKIIDHLLESPSVLDPATSAINATDPLIRRYRRDAAVVFFYCLRADEERRKPENVLRSFVKQLALRNANSFLLLLTKFKEKEDRGFLSQTLSLQECQELLKEMAACFSTTLFVLDALDECHEESRGGILSTFNTLIEYGLPVKVLISSRRDDDIRLELSDKANISISATENGDDIMRFVRQRIYEFQQSPKAISKAGKGQVLIPPELEDRIVKEFLQKSGGM